MRSVNKVILIGNLTRDPELKTTTGGQSIVTFGLATNRQWTTSNGEKRSSSEFCEIVAWARLAEICKDYLKKGMLVYVEGYLKTRSWENPDGTRRFKTEIVANDMIILEKRADREAVDAMMEEAGMQPTDESGSESNDDATPEESPAPATEPAPEAEVTAPTDEAEATPGQVSASIDDDNMF